MARGRAAEAGSWLRLHERLAALIAPPEKAPPEKPAPARPTRPPDPYAALSLQARALEGLARDIAALKPHDAAGRAALETRLAGLGDAPASDLSDLSDPVSPAPESGSAPDSS